MNLSNLELEVMRLIWRDKEVIAPDLHRELEKDRELSYSTVKTIVDRPEEKGAIGRIRTYGRTILYGPLIQEKELAKPMAKDLLRRLFAGKARRWIMPAIFDAIPAIHTAAVSGQGTGSYWAPNYARLLVFNLG